MASDKTGLNFIDKFEGILDLSFTLSESTENLTYKWEIDWNNRNIICEGINFYQGFYEYLSCSIRDFYVDINRSDVYTRLIILINQADKILKICFDIYSGIVRNKMLPVTFISGSSHIPPYSIFRDFARSIKSSKLGFINCNLAYESYFSNLSTKLASTMCVTDMTLYPELRAPFLPRKDKFDRWYSENKSNKEYLDKANSIIKMDRVGLDSNVKEDELIAFIELKKKEGKKIICAFGKVPVDLCVPYDGGPAHKDLGDWINHTVKICSESNDIILLVKPHPHELRPQISLDLVRGFSELISEECSENIIILGHKDINGHTLASYIDLALLYNGSSALELVSQGVPVLMASYFGRLDYPIKLIYPKSRSQYSRFIRSLNYKKPSLEIKNRAAFLICYMGTDEVSILNEYSERQITNDRIFPKWRHEKIKLFLENGDHRMEGVARTIIEKYEK
jgi:capsular polysaccharide export protein